MSVPSCCKLLFAQICAADDALSNCFSCSNVAEENGKKLTILKASPEEVICKAKIDGCIIKSDKLKKCDFLFHRPGHEPYQYMLVELKGSDISQAVEQIKSTFLALKPKTDTAPQQWCGRIVSSAVPKNAELKFRKLQAELLKTHKLKVEKHHNQATVK